MKNVIASRGNLGAKSNQLNFFVEEKSNGEYTLMIEHINDSGELVLTVPIEKQDIVELATMFKAALEEENKNE